MTDHLGMIRVARALDHGRYAVTVQPDEWHSAEWVPGTGIDRTRWTTARRRYEDDLAHAEAVLRGRRPWWRRGRLANLRWLPGYRTEQRTAELRARAAEEAVGLAWERYRPIEEEIRARVSAAREERQRIAREKERLALEARKRWELHERLAAIARRQVWGWAMKGQTTALVFRLDTVGAETSRGDRPARGPFPLDALGDELYEYGMITVRWDDATMQAVAEDCAAAGQPLSFAEWWAGWAANSPWKDPHQAPTAWCTSRPPWPVPTRRSRQRLERGTSHHGSYGAGDFGSFGHF